MDESTHTLRSLPCYESCYVCGPSHPQGLRVRFFATDDLQIRASFAPAPWMCGYDTVVHGGVVSALLDELIGWAVALESGLLACTAELTVRFIKPVLIGTSFSAFGRAAGGKGRLREAAGEIADSAGVVYAKASGRYFLFAREQSNAVVSKMTYRPEDLPAFTCSHFSGGGNHG